MLAVTVPAVQTAPPLDPSRAVSSWPQGGAVRLTRDMAHAQPVQEPTTVHVASDGTFLYVRFDAVQREAVTATQHSNDVVTGGNTASSGVMWGDDDAVWIDVWPTGPSGFEYQFEANPNGSHNEASTENTAFAPQWTSRGSIGGDGYTVTMAIPLAVIHGGRGGTWRMQFLRYVRTTGALDVWSYDVAQTNPDDPAYAGSATVPALARAPLPKPRAAVYALGAIASRAAGGPTTRVGADFSIPVTATAALFGTLHPDYSNVELDQQSISPTVYARTYAEVRPFFTQAASYYNQFSCSFCGGILSTLYTPAIPTPADGYAFEGKQGDFSLAAFDAVGDGRTDDASVIDYMSDDAHWQGSFQHVSTDLPGLTDATDQGGMRWWNGSYLTAYANYAQETGSDVSDESQAQWADLGGGWQSQDFALLGRSREVGDDFNPVDGFDPHPGIAGYTIFSDRIWTFAPQDVFSSAGAVIYINRFQGAEYGQSQSDNQVLFDMLARDAVDVQLYSGSDYWRFGSLLTPVSQAGGMTITYHSGMQDDINTFPSHGASATPTSISYTTGRYGVGRLDSWVRSSTMRVGERGSLTFTADDTAQWMPHAAANVQWFNGISYAYQIASNSSFAVGVRSIVGYPPQPNGGGDCEGRCSNVSVAYHLRLAHEEVYLAYGDPNALVTVPQAILKIIFYAGEKGT